MNKFGITSEEISEKKLLKCILKKSAFVQKSDIKGFYTYKDKPENWEAELIQDIREADEVIYKRKTFYVSRGPLGICFVFHENFVYSFDPFYADCPILEKILNK